MKKHLSIIYVNRVFTAATLVVAAAFLAFLAYAYASFSGPLIGDINTQIPPELLSRLDEKQMETTLDSMRMRASLPDVPADLPDPYDPVPLAPPPAP